VWARSFPQGGEVDCDELPVGAVDPSINLGQGVC
jgi:hypothetical protein